MQTPWPMDYFCQEGTVITPVLYLQKGWICFPEPHSRYGVIARALNLFIIPNAQTWGRWNRVKQILKNHWTWVICNSTEWLCFPCERWNYQLPLSLLLKVQTYGFQGGAQIKIRNSRSSRLGAVETNPIRNHEVVGSIPGLAQGIKDPALLWAVV